MGRDSQPIALTFMFSDARRVRPSMKSHHFLFVALVLPLVDARLTRDGEPLKRKRAQAPPPSRRSTPPPPSPPHAGAEEEGGVELHTGAGNPNAPKCLPFCRDSPCTELNGNTEDECGGCPRSHKCRPGEPGYGPKGIAIGMSHDEHIAIGMGRDEL